MNCGLGTTYTVSPTTGVLASMLLRLGACVTSSLGVHIGYDRAPTRPINVLLYSRTDLGYWVLSPEFLYHSLNSRRGRVPGAGVNHCTVELILMPMAMSCEKVSVLSN